MKIQSTKNFGTNQLKIVVYGPAGVGKTSLAATCEGKAAVVSAEGGLLSLRDKDVDFIDITKDDDGKLITDESLRLVRLKEAYDYLNSAEARKKYSWIFVDSITEISQLFVKAYQKEFPDPKNNFQLWGKYGDSMRTLVKAFRDIPEYNCCLVALSTTEKDDLGKISHVLDVQGKIGDQLPGYVDEVFYYHVGDVDGVKIRKLVTQPSDKILAKDRSGKLDVLEDPDLNKIALKINGGKK